MTTPDRRRSAPAPSIEQLADRIERSAAAWESSLEELASAALAFAESPEVPPEARQHVLASLERLADTIDAPPIEGVTAAGAGEGRVAVDLDLVGRLAGALRAGDVELYDALLHGHSSFVVGDITTIAGPAEVGIDPASAGPGDTGGQPGHAEGDPVRLTIDGSAIGRQAERVFSALAELSQRLPELGPRLVGALDAGDELFSLELDPTPASGAAKLVVRLEPGDGLRRLLAACGAGDADIRLIEEASRHLSSPSLDLDTPTIAGPVEVGIDPASAGPGDTGHQRGEAVLQSELIPDGVAIDEEGGAWLKWLPGSRTFGAGPRRYNLGAAGPGKVTTGHLSAILEAARNGPVLVVGSALIESWHRPSLDVSTSTIGQVGGVRDERASPGAGPKAWP